jgi:hypothetical protein
VELKRRRHQRARTGWTPVTTNHRMGHAVHVIAEMEDANKQDVLSELVAFAIAQHPKWKRAVDAALPAVVAVDPAELPDYDFGVTGTEGLTAAQKHDALIQFAGGPFRITDTRLTRSAQAAGV